MTDAVMSMVTIYDSPTDLPGKFVARKWLIAPGQAPILSDLLGAFDTLDQARDAVPPQLDYRMPRSYTDDPTIVETWM